MALVQLPKGIVSNLVRQIAGDEGEKPEGNSQLRYGVYRDL
jgi:hypothetical protein